MQIYIHSKKPTKKIIKTLAKLSELSIEVIYECCYVLRKAVLAA